MDCLFNLQIPKTTPQRYVIRPKSKPYTKHLTFAVAPVEKTFITGVAQGYDTTYPSEHALLMEKLSEPEFSYIIGHVNQTVTAFWPCSFIIVVGYLFALFTFGLSFMLPNMCIKDARKSLIEFLEQ